MIFTTVCPNKHGNSVWLADTQPLHTFILPSSWAEVDKLNIVTAFPCLLGLTVEAVNFCIERSLYYKKAVSYGIERFFYFIEAVSYCIERSLFYICSSCELWY